MCVCVCVHACVRWERENSCFKHTHIDRTYEKCGFSSGFLCSRSITSQKKYCHTTQNTTPSGNNAMKFSNQVSEAHAAARVKGPDAADFGRKACTEAFQQLLSNSPWTHIFKTCCRRRGHVHNVLWQGEVLLLTDRLSSASSARSRFTRAQLCLAAWDRLCITVTYGVKILHLKMAVSNADKAGVLNKFFSSVFTRENTTNIPHTGVGEKSGGITLTDVRVTPKAVQDKLSTLNKN